MDIGGMLSAVTDLAQNHKIISAALLAALCLFAFKKPKEFFRTVAFFAVLALIFYIFSLIGDSMTTGVEEKKKGTTKIEKYLE